ncbi:hypothetical protein ACJ41O_015186 [Fusarium nematophilum]
MTQSASNSSQLPPVDGYVDPDFPNPDGPMDTPIIIYGYTPSFALAVFAAVWFSIFFIVHSAQTIRYRTWWFIPFAVGLGLEVVGYIGRCLSAKKDPYHLIFYIINYFFIVTAPVFMAASVYTILSALIPRLGRQHALLSPRVILWFFITSDAVATVVQVTGAALVGRRASARKDPKPANNVLLAGLAYQVFAMTVFIALTTVFIARGRQAIKKAGILMFITVLSMATLMIYLRTVFRLAEAAEGLWGPLSVHEVHFACLEFAPVALAVLLFAAYHPGRYIGASLHGSEDKPTVVV